MKTKKDMKVLGIVAAVLLLAGAAADLQISHFLYNPGSVFGKIFEIIGEFPSTFIASLCAMIIALSQKRTNWQRIGSFILAILLSLMAGFLLTAYWDGPKALSFVFAVVIGILCYFTAKAVCKDENSNAYKAARLGLALFLCVIVFFNLVKYGWGRERYRHMAAVGDFSGFSLWFIPRGPASGNEFMSFPSGHSANAAIVMWITLLPSFVPSLAKKETMLKVIAVIWIACVMISRIIMGAHFLSDVTMGMVISLVLFYILYKKNEFSVPTEML